jgi:cyanophycin synthetase
LLEAKKYTLETVLPKAKIFHLENDRESFRPAERRLTAPTTRIRENVFLFERIAKIVGLDVAGIDVIAPNVSEPLTENGGGIIEVNAAPGFECISRRRRHRQKRRRTRRRYAVSAGKPARIPIFAITGTNGKTTTTRLIAHIFAAAAASSVLRRPTELIFKTIKSSRATIPDRFRRSSFLKDPSVQVAVLETARGGIIRSGLGYDHCDIGRRDEHRRRSSGIKRRQHARRFGARQIGRAAQRFAERFRRFERRRRTFTRCETR